MGNIIRMMTYSQTLNKQNAIGALSLVEGTRLRWWCLNDNVMGGASTSHQAAYTIDDGSEVLRFSGEINTSGGGFASVRATIDPLPADTYALCLRYRGDGKTYKFLLSNGESTGPFSSNPSWQHDLTTVANEWCETELRLAAFKPSIGGSLATDSRLNMKPDEQRQIGIMLSLLLSDGSPNPPATFGEGKFPFELSISSIRLMPCLQQEDEVKK